MPWQEPAQELHKVKLVLVRLPMDQLVVPEEGKKGEVRCSTTNQNGENSYSVCYCRHFRHFQTYA